jgi:hypothetical protein
MLQRCVNQQHPASFPRRLAETPKLPDLLGSTGLRDHLCSSFDVNSGRLSLGLTYDP